MIRRVIVKPAQENNANRASDTTLSTPKNVSYSDETYTLTWDAVEHADSYKLDINGNKIDVEGTSYAYLPSHEVTSFKVQALETSGSYKTSEWSDAVSYTVVKGSGMNAATLNVFAAEAVRKDVVKIVFIRPGDDGASIYVCAVDNEGRVQYDKYEYEHPIASLESVIENNDYLNNLSLGAYGAKDYDTAGNYLELGAYKGTLGEYKNDGYTISVVTSQAYEVDSIRIGLYAVFKASKDGETKYLASLLLFNINATAQDSYRYTYGVKDIEMSKVREVFCVELQGDFLDAMEYYVEGFQKD